MPIFEIDLNSEKCPSNEKSGCEKIFFGIAGTSRLQP